MALDTQSKRRIMTDCELDIIDRTNSKEKGLQTEAGMLISNFLDPSNEDYANRLNSVSKARQITDAVEEIHALDGKYYMKDNYASSWLKTRSYELKSYLPPILQDGVKDSQGNYISTSLVDFDKCFDIIKPYRWAKRGNLLDTHGDFYYDDPYLMVRTIHETIKYYGDVVNDVWKGSWGKIKKSYKTVMTGFDEVEHDTDPKPQLPSPADIKDVVGTDGEPGGIMATINESREVLKKRSTDVVVPEWYKQLECSPSDLKWRRITFYVHDDNMTEKFAQEVLDTIPKYLYYELSSTEYMIMDVYDKRLHKEQPQLKIKYNDSYGASDNSLKYYLYDNDELQDYYDGYRYSARIVLRLYSTGYKNPSLRGCPTETVTDEAFQRICKQIRIDLYGNISNARRVYNGSDEITRCTDLDPKAHYDFFYNTILSYKLINVKQCNEMIDFINTELVQWVDKRIITLQKTALDLDNVGTMLELLEERLTKNTGSFLMWYNSILMFDDTYEDYLRTREIAKHLLKPMLVVKAYSSYDENMFNYAYKPDYIDVEDPDELFNWRYRFQNDDDIYILNEFYETKAKITNITYTKVTVSNSQNLSYSDLQGSIDPSILNTTKRVMRLHLDKNLEEWCHTDDVRDIRVAKIIKS